MIAPARAGARYQQLDRAARVEGATPHGLVAILYEELLGALDTMARAHTDALHADQRTRAVTICHALEGGLDLDQGGTLARELARIYRGLRVRLSTTKRGDDLAPTRAGVVSLAQAWARIAG